MKVHELIKQLQDLKFDGADVVIVSDSTGEEVPLELVEADDDGGVVVLTAKEEEDEE